MTVNITKAILIFFVLGAFYSCSDKPLTPKEIYDENNSAVVLIKHEYFHKARFENGLEIFYSGQGGSFKYYFTQEEVMQTPSISNATGFLVDSLGTIATNLHVVSPNHDEINYAKLQNALLEANHKAKEDLERFNKVKLKIAQFVLYEHTEPLTQADSKYIAQVYQNILDSIQYFKNFISLTNFNPKNTKSALYTIELSVAFNGSQAESKFDYHDCRMIAKDKNEGIDLALLQLVSKQTPYHLKWIKLKDQTLPNINDNVYMIGYNYGYELAKTTQGIKSQLTQGSITQEPDNYKILYSIPTLHGSSGSPILNQKGEVIAINFAGVKNTQAFNLGVPVSHLIKLYNQSKERIYNLDYDREGTQDISGL